MTPILQDSIEYLWYSIWGMVAGWGLTTTLIVTAVVVLLIKYLRLYKRVVALENRLIHAERDYNLSLEKIKNKNG